MSPNTKSKHPFQHYVYHHHAPNTPTPSLNTIVSCSRPSQSTTTKSQALTDPHNQPHNQVPGPHRPSITTQPTPRPSQTLTINHTTKSQALTDPHNQPHNQPPGPHRPSQSTTQPTPRPSQTLTINHTTNPQALTDPHNQPHDRPPSTRSPTTIDCHARCNELNSCGCEFDVKKINWGEPSLLL
ncbi:putative transcription factor capicua [Penaeus japonicus]|uniref:putative transcription factor capicua n=1 Tax=Penaeus japonicus TaxID=27405 RepID=UPI001C7148B6|nr:putative transcription factor capicua [Penaeus japonicus]